MPFNFLGTMRQCQWKAFRDWTLGERCTISSRMRVINAELRRIGNIVVFYERRQQTNRSRHKPEDHPRSM